MTTRITDGGATLEITQDVFDDKFERGGAWRTKTRAYSRDIKCRECDRAMSFPEWEQNFWRCPRCGEQN